MDKSRSGSRLVCAFGNSYVQSSGFVTTALHIWLGNSSGFNRLITGCSDGFLR
jgi:hypothetical protein